MVDMESNVPMNPAATLYIGDLHQDVTEAMLHKKFSSAGLLLSIRVCRDRTTRQSLGYAYVNFEQREDAEHAMEHLNFTMLMGRPIRIMWYQQDPSLRKSGVGNIFLKNLHKSIDSEALYDTFSCFGKILSCKVACDENGSKGYGFVHFESVESAKKSIEKINGMLLNGKKVFVGPFKSRKDREAELGVRPKKRNVVRNNNFGERTDDEKMRNGKCDNTMGMQITSEDHSKSRTFDINSVEKPEDAQKGVHIYVKNLDKDIDNERLHKEFSPFGTVTSAKVIMEDGRSKGCGFVSFSTPEEAAMAVRKMNGRMVSTKPLYANLVISQKERKARLTYQDLQQSARVRAPPSASVIAVKPQDHNKAAYYPTYKLAQRYTDSCWDSLSVKYRKMSVKTKPSGPRRQASPSRPISHVPQMISTQNVDGLVMTSQPATVTAAPVQCVPQLIPAGVCNPQEHQLSMQQLPDVHMQGQKPLSISMLAAASPQTQKQMIGNSLFPLVQAKHPRQAGKITGMLLLMDNSDLLYMLGSPEILQSKIDEAVAVLQDNQAHEAAQKNGTNAPKPTA